jgi:hypothetical protein
MTTVVATITSACTNDFYVPPGPTLGTGERSPEASTQEGAVTSTDDSGAPPNDAKSSAKEADAGTTNDGSANDGATAAGKLPNGASCKTATDNSTECQSGVCATQGGGGVRAGTFCTIDCNKDGQPDAVCAGVIFSGQCGPEGECIVK